MKLLDWFRAYINPKPYYKTVRFVSSMSSVPDETGRDIYVVERFHRRHWAVLACPCEAGHRLTINLSRNKRPCWTISIVRGRATISPSLWLKTGCQSHFWIRRSAVYWATDLDNWDGEEGLFEPGQSGR